MFSCKKNKDSYENLIVGKWRCDQSGSKLFDSGEIYEFKNGCLLFYDDGYLFSTSYVIDNNTLIVSALLGSYVYQINVLTKTSMNLTEIQGKGEISTFTRQ